MIAEVLERVRPSLPAERLSYRFLDEDTVVLPLVGASAVWFFSKPPNPLLELRDDVPSTTGTHTGFQELLAARAAGPLERVEQPKLDRVAVFRFAAAEGFVRTQPCKLIFELTGRNCNLILTDLDDVILGAAREVPASINRYRQVRPGLTYRPPPPYEKFDPRKADPARLAEALRGKKVKNLHKVVDGVGTDLTATVATMAQATTDDRLDGELLARILEALEEVVAAPQAVMQAALDLPDVATLRRREQRQDVVERVTHAIERQRELAKKRIHDAERTIEAGEEATELRHRADLLMAYQRQVPDHVPTVELDDFTGERVEIALDPKLDAVGNAESLYTQARKRERRAERAESRIDELEAEIAAFEARLADLADQDLETLEKLAERLAPEDKRQARKGPGIRYVGPHDFEIVVGRSAKENDEITFKLARSRDVWLHVQGYHGAHVIVRAGNQEVPFDTILFAAQLAAGHSQAADSENVPVDYTQKKNVWKTKGMPVGAVRFTQQKTVYVTPRRQVKRDEPGI